MPCSFEIFFCPMNLIVIYSFSVKIQKIEGVLAKHLQKKVKKKKLPAPLFAYITFEQSVGAHRAIQIYRDSWLTYWFMDEKRRFQGCRLKVHKSPQPSVIIWENLGYSAWHRFRRRALTWIISIALLVLSAICSFTSRAFEQRAQNAGGQEPCPEGFDSLSKEDQRSYAKDNPGEYPRLYSYLLLLLCCLRNGTLLLF